MAPPTFVKSLALEGFRAYLQPKVFDLNAKRNIAIFAPNGSGKSSVIDALEFLFSPHGTLKRLGQRAINNLAGPGALAHNLAEEAKITPIVRVVTVTDKATMSGDRPASGVQRAMPAAVADLLARFTVSPIIRGHELRAFVEAQTVEDRYEEVARWLQITPFVEAQKNLRMLRQQVRAASEDRQALTHIDGALARETAQAVKTWDDAAVLSHINDAVLSLLAPDCSIAALDEADRAFVVVRARANAEERRIGLAGLKQVQTAMSTLWTRTDEDPATGAIPRFGDAVAGMDKAGVTEADERSKAASATFEAVWTAAHPLFVEGALPPDTCPVCATPLSATTAGSAEAIRVHIATHLDELAAYAAAKAALDAGTKVMDSAKLTLSTALASLVGLLGDDQAELKADLEAYSIRIDHWTKGSAPESTGVVAALETYASAIAQQISDIQSRQGEHTYAKALARIERLIELRDERARALRVLEELSTISDALTAQAAEVTSAIRQQMQSLLDSLQSLVNTIYREIQGEKATPIRLELPNEADTSQNRLNLYIDFAANRTGVHPAGYLSDSQIHSAALALRLAAIQQFNADAPIVALDDIVTSYDADHRRAIAGLIAKRFRDCQLIITTHDERFFNYLKDQLEIGAWQFTRIIGLDPSYGPRFAEHKVTDEMIGARWAAGEKAANEMRQAEEEWLLAICRDFGVSVRIRHVERPYAYDRGELASALVSMLKSAKLEAPLVPGVNNVFLTSLNKGEIENFGSHFQDGPYGDGSIGDEQARWAEFRFFRRHFACGSCRRTRFKRPLGLTKPVCAHDGCETQFQFTAVSIEP